MKKYIIILLALLIFSCDEDNIVKDDRVNAKKEGWVVIDTIVNKDTLYKNSFFPVNILDVNENTLYLRMYNDMADFEGWIYKKTLNQEPEYISTVSGYVLNLFENFIIAGVEEEILSNDYGKTNIKHNSFYSLDALKKNDDLYILTMEKGILKMQYNLENYEIIDSSFIKIGLYNEKEYKYNPYQFFQIFDNMNCLLLNFRDHEILFTSDNFSKKEIIKMNSQIFEDFENEKNYLLRRWISVVSENIIYCRADKGLYKSTNRGKDWSLILDINFNWHAKLIALTKNIIYILDEDKGKSILYASTDGGATFEIQEIPEGVVIFDFYFVNENLGYAVCKNGEILKTTSGGFKDN